MLGQENIRRRVVALDKDLTSLLRFRKFCKIWLESLEVMFALLFLRQSEGFCVSDASPVAAIPGTLGLLKVNYRILPLLE